MATGMVEVRQVTIRSKSRGDPLDRMKAAQPGIFYYTITLKPALLNMG